MACGIKLESVSLTAADLAEHLEVFQSLCGGGVITQLHRLPIAHRHLSALWCHADRFFTLNFPFELNRDGSLVRKLKRAHHLLMEVDVTQINRVCRLK